MLNRGLWTVDNPKSGWQAPVCGVRVGVVMARSSGAGATSSGLRVASTSLGQFCTIVALSALGVACFAPGVWNGFCFDDKHTIVRNTDVLPRHNDTAVHWQWQDVFAHDYWGMDIADPASHKSYRPLTTMSFRATAVLAEYVNGGASSDADAYAPVFHAVDAVLHAAVTVLVGVLALVTAPSGYQATVAFVATALFAVHPVHGDAVSSASGRAETLAAICTLASVLCYRASLRSVGALRRTKWTVWYLAIAAVLAAAGTLCKEVGIMAFALHGVVHLCDPLEGPILWDAVARLAARVGTPVMALVHNASDASAQAARDRAEVASAAASAPSTPVRGGGSGDGASNDDGEGTGAKLPPQSSDDELFDDSVSTAGSVRSERSGWSEPSQRSEAKTPPVLKPCSPDAGAGHDTPVKAGRQPVAFGSGRSRGSFRRRRSTSRHKPLRALRRRGAVAVLLWPLASLASLGAVLYARLRLQAFALPSMGSDVTVTPDGGVLVRFAFGRMDNPAMWHETPTLHSLLTMVYVHFRHALLLVWPWSLSADYSGHTLPLVTSMFDWRLWVAAAAAGVMAVGVARVVRAWRARRGWARTAALAIGFVVLPYLPASNLLFTVGFVVAERVLYLPSIGACILVRPANSVRWCHALARSHPCCVGLPGCAVLGQISNTAQGTQARGAGAGGAVVCNSHRHADAGLGERLHALALHGVHVPHQ